jgi:hypothetical protein
VVNDYVDWGPIKSEDHISVTVSSAGKGALEVLLAEVIGACTSIALS